MEPLGTPRNPKELKELKEIFRNTNRLIKTGK